MAKKDYYKVLGVNKNATPDEIRSAYRQQAKKYHPDISKEPNAEEKFKEVQEAYACLSDEKKRARYDSYGHDGVDFGGQDFSNYGSYQDIINEFFSSFGFGGFGGGQRSSSSRASMVVDGDDRMLELTLSFDEAVHGCKKTIMVNKNQECPTCKGSGALNKQAIKQCSRCKGTGVVIVRQNSIFGQIQTQTICPNCEGSGKTIAEVCKECRGKKVSTTNKKIEIVIPEGVDTGTHLRVRGYGDDGINGGRTGDLFIKFNVNPSPKFERKGYDIYSYASISMSQAALGDYIKVDTIHGLKDLTIPNGLKSGSILKIKEQGIINTKENRKGDHFVVVNIITPKNLTLEQRQLYTRLGEIDGSLEK